MKAFLSLILFFSIGFVGYAQQDYPDSGFTNKAEAKNLMVNGLKEGKWLEYVNIVFDGIEDETTDTNAEYYYLTVYKFGNRYGIRRKYRKNRTLEVEYPDNDNKRNWVIKWYHENGKLKAEQPFTDSGLNGIEKDYYETGELEYEIPYFNNMVKGIFKGYYKNGNIREEVSYPGRGWEIDEAKNYYENGKVKSETVFYRSGDKVIKNFDENGNEIK